MYEQRMLCCVHMCEVKNSTPLVYDKLEKTSTFFIRRMMKMGFS